MKKTRTLQHQKNIWKIEYRKLERVLDIWRKISSTVSWKNFQYRKKLISKGKRYRIPYTVNISKETFWNKIQKIFKKTTKKLVKNQQTAKKMAETWSMLSWNRTRSLARSQTYTNQCSKTGTVPSSFFFFPPFFSCQNALFVSNCTTLYFVSFTHFSSFSVQ
jgi:hypothetical protein